MLSGGESGGVPNFPIGQSAVMAQGDVAFYQASPLVPQVSASVPQQYFQVKRGTTLT